ncbi:hypothetical protein L195_g040269 [Trifolium pratense]|uniref:Uncharacterized protein n=4 Tax=Trifolium pratense TaxID=57577 RepID=A0ACB0ISZ8_TRIPR|nr:hypothetical protein L195_g040269 [Trifolium pratense]CAJ2635419.1 unnamed protein product [Trifolium pratense]
MYPSQYLCSWKPADLSDYVTCWLIAGDNGNDGSGNHEFIIDEEAKLRCRLITSAVIFNPPLLPFHV